MRRTFAFLIAGFCLQIAPAAAAEFVPPAGCTGTFTVQFKGCIMLNVWQCQDDQDGDQWVGLFTSNGLRRLRKIDSEFQWLETYHVGSGLVERIEQPAPDPENLTELMRDGVDTYDFTITETGPTAGPNQRYVGYDRLSGETTVIDGETLLNTEYAYDVLTSDGEVTRQRMGAQFVHPTQRLFLFGTSQNADGSEASDNRPMSFAHPGDTDFFPNFPLFDCGSVTS
ncbi:hypothetical protein [Algirhabdus cladophorae]|uniref:hypothetical protein n=1 Tax=Algirhabdus cladophorae TaxID=3377108 RepID=UPI003B8455DB